MLIFIFYSSNLSNNSCSLLHLLISAMSRAYSCGFECLILVILSRNRACGLLVLAFADNTSNICCSVIASPCIVVSSHHYLAVTLSASSFFIAFSSSRSAFSNSVNGLGLSAAFRSAHFVIISSTIAFSSGVI